MNNLLMTLRYLDTATAVCCWIYVLIAIAVFVVVLIFGARNKAPATIVIGFACILSLLWFPIAITYFVRMPDGWRL
jgi:hypothetical protein